VGWLQKLPIKAWKLSTQTPLHVKAQQLHEILVRLGRIASLRYTLSKQPTSFPSSTFLKVMCCEQIAT
jgi:hypothetical protein